MGFRQCLKPPWPNGKGRGWHRLGKGTPHTRDPFWVDLFARDLTSTLQINSPQFAQDRCIQMLLPRVRRVTPKFVANVFVGITFATTSCLLAGSTAYAAEELRHLLDNAPAVPTLSEYGGVGLLDTRTARFMPDGYISATILIKNPDDRVSETFQALPWMEATFRWAHNYAIEVGSQAGQGADRSFDAKFRLISESDYWQIGRAHV